MRAAEVIHDLVDRFLRRRPADIRQRAGAEALGYGSAELDDARRLRHGECLCVRIRHHEFDALKPFVDHVVDGVAATAADPDDGDLRAHFGDRGLLEIVHGLSPRADALQAPTAGESGSCYFRN
ncbi:hypothetical protein D9M72_505520 [compost metagenome]